MTKTQRQIAIGGAIVFILLLLYPPWKLEYEGGASLVAYSFVFSPPNEYRRQDGNRSVPPQATSVAAWMLLGELAAVAAVTGFLVWVYRPAPSIPAATVAPASDPV